MTDIEVQEGYADHDGGEFSAVTSEWWPLGQLSFANTSAAGKSFICRL